MSKPDSMIFVQTRRLYSLLTNPSITFSRLTPSHLSMGDSQRGLRNDPFEMVGHGMDRLNTGMDEEDLTSPLEFPLQWPPGWRRRQSG